MPSFSIAFQSLTWKILVAVADTARQAQDPSQPVNLDQPGDSDQPGNSDQLVCKNLALSEIPNTQKIFSCIISNLIIIMMIFWLLKEVLTTSTNTKSNEETKEIKSLEYLEAQNVTAISKSNFQWMILPQKDTA